MPVTDPLHQLLAAVQRGELAPDTAAARLRSLAADNGHPGLAAATEDLGFATVDHDRARRCGAAEVIFGQGKTAEQVVAIAESILGRHPCALITRLQPDARARVHEHFGQRVVDEAESAGAVLLGTPPELPTDAVPIPIVAAGTSDLPVADEAALTCRTLGQPTVRVTDVGVAGLHRILSRVDELRAAHVVVVVAGMEGALPSVVAGLVDAPVIAVPTSVGYGASFGGIAALLGMLNACGSGVTVVNIDNGFGAGFAASKINRLAASDGSRTDRPHQAKNDTKNKAADANGTTDAAR